MVSNLNNFHSLEVVDRVSETQLQVRENYNRIILRLKSQLLNRLHAAKYIAMVNKLWTHSTKNHLTEHNIYLRYEHKICKIVINTFEFKLYIYK